MYKKDISSLSYSATNSPVAFQGRERQHWRTAGSPACCRRRRRPFAPASGRRRCSPQPSLGSPPCVSQERVRWRWRESRDTRGERERPRWGWMLWRPAFLMRSPQCPICAQDVALHAKIVARTCLFKVIPTLWFSLKAWYNWLQHVVYISKWFTFL